MKHVTLLAAAAVALTPVAALAIAPPAKTYVMKAGAGDMFEIESSKLVQDSANPQVKSFADKMISDHTKSTADIMAAAQADGLSPVTPKMNPTQTAMIDALRRTSGAKRDTLYEKDQLQSHRQALALHKEYAMSGDKPALKAAAQKIAPIVQDHLNMAKDMAPAGVKAQ